MINDAEACKKAEGDAAAPLDGPRNKNEYGFPDSASVFKGRGKHLGRDSFAGWPVPLQPGQGRGTDRTELKKRCQQISSVWSSGAER